MVTFGRWWIRTWNAPPVEDRLIAVATLVTLAVAASAGPFPYHDSTNHLARYVLLERAWFGQPVSWTVVRAIPTPYIAIDLLGAGLIHWLGPLVALRVLALLTLVALPAGLYALLRVSSPDQRAWALVGVLLSLSWWYLEGSFNYWMGVGLLFFALASWWPCRSQPTWGRRLVVILAGMLLLFVHLFAALAFLVVVWIDLGLAIRGQIRSGRGLDRSIRERAILATVFAGIYVVTYLVMRMAAAGLTVVPPVLEPRPGLKKLLNLGGLFFGLTATECAIVVLGYAYALINLLRQARPRWLQDTFIVSALAFVGLYVISPGTWNIDVRWLPMAYILPFCVLGQRQAPSRVVMAVLFSCCLLHAGIVAAYARVIRGQLQEMDVVLSRLPAQSRLLPLVADQHRFRARPYVHYALWHTIRTSSPVGGLFSRSGTREGDPTYTHLNHFDVRHALYYPASIWGVDTFEPLDCPRVRRDYDYILLAGWDERAGRRITECAREVSRTGEIRLYQVR